MRRTAFGPLIAAEVGVLLRRPITWVVVIGVIGFVVAPAYLGNVGSLWRARAIPGADGLAAYLSPVNAPFFAVRELAPTGGLLAFALGAFAVGGDFRWGTNVARALHAPGRRLVAAARVTALAVLLLALAALAHLALLVLSATASLPDLGAPSGMPSAWRVLAGVAVSAVTLCFWGAAGVLLAVLLRSATGALVVGAVYRLSIEQTVEFLSHHIETAASIARLLPAGLGTGSAWLLGFEGSWTGLHGLVAPLDPYVSVTALLAATGLLVGAVMAAVARQDL